MATAIPKPASAQEDVTIAGFDFNDECPPEGVDPFFFMCDTDKGCQWAEVCDDQPVVNINGTNYYTWRPKGIKDDGFFPDDPGTHLHLSCSVESGVRIRLGDLVDILEAVTDPIIIDRFCTWVYDNCYQTDEYMQWVCDTIVNFCYEDPTYEQAFCEWFADFVIETPECISAISTWFLTSPDVVEMFCITMLECMQRPNIIDAFCEVLLNECLQDPSVIALVKQIIQNCFLTNIDVRDQICDTVKNYCTTSETWNSTFDPDPTGTTANSQYLIDTVDGCISHICVNDVWTCVPTADVCVPVVYNGSISCPVPFPVIYMGNTFNDSTSLAAQLSIDFGCTVTYDPVTCEMCFPFDCGTPPPTIDVTSPPPSYVQVITDGFYTCPIPFPVIYSGTLYSNGNDLAAAVASDFSCSVIFSSGDCTMCFPYVCTTVPPQIDVTTPQPTYVPVELDGAFPCPVTFPVEYKGLIYSTSGQLASQLSIEYGCTVTYQAATCTMCFPYGCTAPPVIVTTTPPPPSTACFVDSPGAIVTSNFDNYPSCLFPSGPFISGNTTTSSARDVWTPFTVTGTGPTQICLRVSGDSLGGDPAEGLYITDGTGGLASMYNFDSWTPVSGSPTLSFFNQVGGPNSVSCGSQYRRIIFDGGGPAGPTQRNRWTFDCEATLTPGNYYIVVGSLTNNSTVDVECCPEVTILSGWTAGEFYQGGFPGPPNCFHPLPIAVPDATVDLLATNGGRNMGQIVPPSFGSSNLSGRIQHPGGNLEITYRIRADGSPPAPGTLHAFRLMTVSNTRVPPSSVSYTPTAQMGQSVFFSPACGINENRFDSFGTPGSNGPYTITITYNNLSPGTYRPFWVGLQPSPTGFTGRERISRLAFSVI